VSVQARRVVFLIDRSTSMAFNGGLAAAKRELLANVNHLPATARFQVLFYDRTVEAIRSTEPDHLLPNSDETRKQIQQLVNRIRAQGGTDHMAALLQALRLRPEVILFMTDAEDLQPAQVRMITDLNGARSVIHTLEWSKLQGNNEQLKTLADLNRGIHRKLGYGHYTSDH
jgi:Mg-chelatase subunit ChlD